MSPVRRVCVFCGSNRGRNAAYSAAAGALGESIAKQGVTLVYGGGRVGLMGVVADAVLGLGGRVVGVIPRAIATDEVAHPDLTVLHVVGSMHERKALMADLAQGFVALPGGFGTLDELCEILTWAQLGMHRKPVGLLNVEGYFDPLLAFLDQAVSDGFVRPPHRRLLIEGRDPSRILQVLSRSKAPVVSKWLDGRADLR